MNIIAEKILLCGFIAENHNTRNEQREKPNFETQEKETHSLAEDKGKTRQLTHQVITEIGNTRKHS